MHLINFYAIFFFNGGLNITGYGMFCDVKHHKEEKLLFNPLFSFITLYAIVFS